LSPPNSERPYLIAVMGETASGKTALAESLAERLDAQLVNADTFQVYRGMDVGTAKPADKSKYKLIDIKNPDEQFGVGEFVQLALPILEECYSRGKSVVVVGGTGLNIRALFEEFSGMMGTPDPELRAELNRTFAEMGLPFLVERLRQLDPEAAQVVDLANPVRVIRAIEKASVLEPQMKFRLPEFRKAKICIDVPLAELERRIETRVHQMVQNGWLLEIERLCGQGYRPDDPGFRAIGYRAMWDVAKDRKGLEQATAETVLETRRYAKRQRTWLRREPNLTRLSADSATDLVERALEGLPVD
jgi:tRNA dimethylallyltransferase